MPKAEQGVEIRTPYARGARHPGISFEGEEKITRDSFKDECDLNKIIARYLKGGGLPPVPEGVFLDVRSVGGYREVRDRMVAAEAVFMQLSPEVREAFGNDPVTFLDTMVDPAAQEFLEELGLREKAVPDQGSLDLAGQPGAAAAAAGGVQPAGTANAAGGKPA